MSVASNFERLMLDLINTERTSRGIDPLTLELRLNDASEDHSVWMDTSGNFSHTGVNNSDPGDRMRDAGFTFSGNWTWGENIAYQSERGAPGIADDVADLHQSLMNSPGHRANILNPSFDLIGIGIEVGDGRGFDAVYVTQNFARTGASVQLDLPNVTPPTPPTNPLTGTNGDDRLFGAGGDDRITGAAGNDLLKGGSGDDTILGGQDDDRIVAGRGHDQAKGETGNDIIFGGTGSDRLNGGNGNDRLFGGDGKDRLMGDGGKDRLDGGAGNDRMFGGDGADSFVFSEGQDIVLDFDPTVAGEKINLRGVASIEDYDDLVNGGHLRAVGSSAVIDDLNGNTMLLAGVSVAELHAGDFLF